MIWFQNKWVRYALMICAVALFLGNVLHETWGKGGTGNLHNYQARAFTEGKLHLEPEWLGIEHSFEIAAFQDKVYAPFPPFPAVLLMPLVAVFGAANTAYLALALAAAAMLGLYQIGRQWAGLSREETAWLALALLLGTGCWYALQQSHLTWHFSHVAAVAMLVLAIREGLLGGRGWLAGLLLGCAVLSRQVMIYSAIFVLAILLTQAATRRAQWQAGVGFAAAFGVCLAAYLVFNAVRFSGPLDSGYGYIELGGFLMERVDRYGLFSIAYIPFNFAHMFLQGPLVYFEQDNPLLIIGMTPFGTALPYASPFVAFALWARYSRVRNGEKGEGRAPWVSPQWIIAVAWLSVGLSVLHILLYYNNGWIQLNAQRFALDFMPALMILVMLALKNGNIYRRLLFAAIGYSIILNAYALVGISQIKALLSLFG